jgi:hypothetical protein
MPLRDNFTTWSSLKNIFDVFKEWMRLINCKVKKSHSISYMQKGEIWQKSSNLFIL